MGKRFVIMAGGTGGHVFPALAVAQELLAQGHSVSWLGTRRGLESRVVPNAGIDIDWLTVSGVRGMGVLAKLKAPWMLLDACLQAMNILRRRKPDAVLGMGGFVSGPGALMAKLLGIPLVIHEQNSIPGTTNRWLRRIAKRVLTAFPDCFAAKTGAIVTGNPLRESFRHLPPAKPEHDATRPLRILVVGGSQGAQALNETVPQALAMIKDLEIRHQTGTAMLDAVKDAYRAHGVAAEASAFIDDMAAAYRWADLAVCRSGAMTVSELAASALPSILIPFPFAIDDHQTANARFLADRGAARLLPQAQMTAQSLADMVAAVRQNLAAMSEAARSCAKPDATAEVAAYCIAEAER